jgi:hypothetical protein
MNADERGYLDALTERVLGAIFEVSNSRVEANRPRISDSLANRSTALGRPGCMLSVQLFTGQ